MLDWPYSKFLITLVITLLIGRVANYVLFEALIAVNRRKEVLGMGSMIKHLRRPCGWSIPLFLTIIALGAPAFMDPMYDWGRQLAQVFFVIAFAWTLIQCEDVVQDVIRQQFDVTKEDNIRARTIHTQLNYIRKIFILIVVVLALGVILMNFDSVRQLGTTLLTSAGVAGIIIGMAAQNSIKNLLAGLQIAFTQPIRYDDVVIVEGEWGWIEDITLTYVVVRIWDLRRLVLPLNYFIEQPFQNWTKTNADILGTVFLYVDYTMPIEPLREELNRIVADHADWDKKVAQVQVTNMTDRAMEVRALVSAKNSGCAWNLRCAVREQLITFIQKNYPESLIRVRLEKEPRGKGDEARG